MIVSANERPARRELPLPSGKQPFPRFPLVKGTMKELNATTELNATFRRSDEGDTCRKSVCLCVRGFLDISSASFSGGELVKNLSVIGYSISIGRYYISDNIKWSLQYFELHLCEIRLANYFRSIIDANMKLYRILLLCSIMCRAFATRMRMVTRYRYALFGGHF